MPFFVLLIVTCCCHPSPPFQEEWLTCQRNWLYLESIFLAPDIKRQLPAESKMFTQVDKSWREIMSKVNKMPNALKAATQPGGYSTEGKTTDKRKCSCRGRRS